MLANDTPLYKYEVTLTGSERPGVVFARTPAEADDIAAALSGEPLRTGRTGPVRTMHHPRARGGLHEFTWGERLAEAHQRQRTLAAQDDKHPPA